MKVRKHQSGVLLVAAIFMVGVVAALLVGLAYLNTAGLGTSTVHGQSDAAIQIAASGLEVATRQFANGTACASLTSSAAVGNGTLATTGTLYPTAFTATLQANIANNNVISKIPLSFTVGSIASLAPHGEVLIDNEFITYGGRASTAAECSPVAAPCLTGAVRATNGTAIAAHTTISTFTQLSQCVIRSTGTVDSAKRIVEGTMALNSDGTSGLYSGVSTSTPTAATLYSLTGGAWAPGLPAVSAGDYNYLIAVVSFSGSTVGTLSTINAANLDIVATAPAATIAASTSVIQFGFGAAPSAAIFPQETQVLLARHQNATATSTYNVRVTPATSTNAAARVQMLAINGIPAANTSFFAGGNVALGVAATAVVTSPNTPLLAGNNVVIAAVQLDNTAAALRDVLAGNLALRRGTGVAGTVLASNVYLINLGQSTTANRGTGYLLLALDSGAAAGTQYTVTGLASVAASINASATILAINGLSGASLAPVSTAFGGTATLLGSLTDAFRAGERVVLAGTQYQNGAAMPRNIIAGNETLILNGSTVGAPANAYNWAFCATATTICNDFFSGLLWRASPAAGKPAFGVRAQASGATMAGAPNILSIDLSVREINRAEIIP